MWSLQSDLITFVTNKQPHSEMETNNPASSKSAATSPCWPYYGARSTKKVPQIITKIQMRRPTFVAEGLFVL